VSMTWLLVMAAGFLRFVQVIWARPGLRGSDDHRLPGRARSLPASPAPLAPGAAQNESINP